MGYFDDHRVRAASRDSEVVLRTFDEEGGQIDTPLPTKFEVCPTCEGRGSHVNPSIDSHGLSREDFDDDPDFAEDYMEGRYDVACYGCSGVRVIEVVDDARCPPDQLAAYRKQQEEEAAYQRERAAELRYGY